jgi:hypothetical protein
MSAWVERYSVNSNGALRLSAACSEAGDCPFGKIMVLEPEGLAIGFRPQTLLRS